MKILFVSILFGFSFFLLVNKQIHRKKKIIRPNLCELPPLNYNSPKFMNFFLFVSFANKINFILGTLNRKWNVDFNMIIQKVIFITIY